MNDAFAPAIAALEEDLAKHERKAREIKSAINTLCEHAGLPVRHKIDDGSDAVNTLAAIQADTFYGKTISTASREYLEMRRSSGQGPATPREIYEGLVEGGFLFETKNTETALVSLRNAIRKNSKTFHRLPNNKYGLLAWYPNVRGPRTTDDDENAQSESETTDEQDTAGTSASAENKETDGPANQESAGPPETEEYG